MGRNVRRPRRALLLGVALAAAYPGAALADPPRDVVADAAAGPRALGEAPDGFVDAQFGAVRWEYPEAAADEVRPLIESVPERWRAIEDELGGAVDDDLRIRVGRDPEEMRALAPIGAPPPGYAVGVAYPALGLVLLTLTAPQTWTAPDLPRVLHHELSHIALARRVRGNPLPRWFVEGVAVHQAREQNMARVRALGNAVYGKGPIPLDELDRRFPRRPHEVNLAYAQSADFVRFLLRDEDGRRRFAKTLARVGNGMPFEEAIVNSHLGASIHTLERAWRNDLRERFAYWPLGLTTGLLGALGLALVVYGRFRRRRKEAPVLERWAEEEALLDELQQTQAEAEARDQRADDLEAAARLAKDARPPGALDKDGVPRVRVDGQTHTLH